MDKRYSIIVTQSEDKPLSIKRGNRGFNVFELIGFIEAIKSDLITQSQSMVTKDAKVERIACDADGCVKIAVKEDRVTVTDIE